MSTRSLFLLVLVCLALLVATPAYAVLLVHETFSHDDGVLLGQTPTPGPGGTWVAHSNEGSQPILVSSGAAVLTQAAGSGGREDLHTDFTPQSATATTYAAFDFSLPSATNDGMLDSTGAPLDANGLYFAHFYHGSSTSFRARVGVLSPAADGDFVLAVNANGQSMGGGTSWPTDLSFDTTYRVVVSFDAATGDAQLWLDPTDQSSPSIIDDKDSTGDLMQGYGLRQNTDYEGQQIVDNLCVATTFDGALHCIVPEPTGIVLLLMGVAGIIATTGVRRRI